MEDRRVESEEIKAIEERVRIKKEQREKEAEAPRTE